MFKMLLNLIIFYSSLDSLLVTLVASLASDSTFNSSLNSVSNSCKSIEGLSKKQISICNKYVELIDFIKLGAEKAIQECERQFKYRRWNCSYLNQSLLLGKRPPKGTKEAAFFYAITSAGISYAVTEACSSGQFLTCSCDRTHRKPTKEFHWSGCSHNIAFGDSFSQLFTDARDIKLAQQNRSSLTTARALINLHNNQVGRNALMDNIQVKCKCHGLSGFCHLKICWRALPPFAKVGSVLRQRFDKAKKVPQHFVFSFLYDLHQHNSNYKKNWKIHNHQKLNDNLQTFYRFKKKLIYINSSPNYCERNEETGFFGTQNRECKEIGHNLDSCNRLCCGRGIAKKVETISEKCNCNFVWCCHIKCEQCSKNVTRYTCL